MPASGANRLQRRSSWARSESRERLHGGSLGLLAAGWLEWRWPGDGRCARRCVAAGLLARRWSGSGRPLCVGRPGLVAAGGRAGQVDSCSTSLWLLLRCGRGRTRPAAFGAAPMRGLFHLWPPRCTHRRHRRRAAVGPRREWPTRSDALLSTASAAAHRRLRDAGRNYHGGSAADRAHGARHRPFQDIAQETFIRAYRAMPQFAATVLLHWLYGSRSTPPECLINLKRDPLLFEGSLVSSEDATKLHASNVN